MALDLSVVGKATEPQAFRYTWKDTVLYALGVGAKTAELDTLYEGRGPKVIPSFAVVPMFEPMFRCVERTGGDLSMVVHGGQRVRIKRPLAPEGTLLTRATVRGIYDMRKFAYVIIDTETTDERGEVLFDTTANIIFRDAGGFGGETPPRDKSGITIPKDTPPSFRIEEATSREQALLYRLSGDLNPLHADPDFAAKVGFTQGPILHGLCTYGHMARHVVLGACGGDASKLTGLEGAFKKPVWPGDTLVTEGWVTEPGKVALQVKVKERDEVVLGSAWATTSS